MIQSPASPLASRLRRLVVTPLALAVLTIGIPSAVLLATPGQAAAATSTTKIDGAIRITADRKPWELAVGWFSNISTNGLAIDIATGTDTNGYEQHDWDLSAPSAFKFNGKTGTLASTSPVATVNLTFKVTKSSKVNCTTGGETIYSGTLTGELKLTTGLPAAGTIGGTGLTFNLGTPSVTVDSGCITPTPCTSSLIWGSNGAAGKAAEAVGGYLTGTTDFVGVERLTDLSAPKGAQRVDLAGEESPAPKLSKGVMTITTDAGKIVSGEATLSGGKAATYKSTCTYGSKKYNATTTIDNGATYSSPAGKAITAHTALTGVLTVANSKAGVYDVTTITAA